MENAWDTAVKMWSGLHDIGSALSNIFEIADKEGNGFAAWVEKIGADFKEWTESEEGRESIKQWLEDAAELGRDLGGIIGKLSNAFDTLDSEDGRESLDHFVTLFEQVAAAAELAAGTVSTLNWGAGHSLTNAVIEIDMIKQSLKDISNGDFDKAAGNVGANWARKMLEGYNGAARTFGAQEEETLSAAFDAALERVKRKFSAFGGWISETVGGWWGSTQTGFSQWWASVSAWFSEKKSEVGAKVKDWMTVDWGGIWSDFTASMSSGWETVSG